MLQPLTLWNTPLGVWSTTHPILRPPMPSTELLKASRTEILPTWPQVKETFTTCWAVHSPGPSVPLECQSTRSRPGLHTTDMPPHLDANSGSLDEDSDYSDVWSCCGHFYLPTRKDVLGQGSWLLVSQHAVCASASHSAAQSVNPLAGGATGLGQPDGHHHTLQPDAGGELAPSISLSFKMLNS